MRRNQLILIGFLMAILLGVAFEAGLSAELFQGVQPTSHFPPSFQLAEGTFNLQIQAVEVTQGVRGDIPVRIAPDGDLVLPADGAVHIADRRTVVRVYPWVQTGGSVILPPVTAHLWAYRDGELLPGSPLSPQNNQLDNIASGQTIVEMRSDAQTSWNFLLPDEWIAGNPDHSAFNLRFVVEANPAGPDQQAECQGCAADNQVILDGQQFVTVPPLVVQPYFVEHTLMERDGSQVTYPGPTQQELAAVMQVVHSMLPVGDPDHGLVLLPPIDIEWQGMLYQDGRHVFAEAMVDQYLPGGSLRGNQGGTIHLFVFSADGRHNFLVNYHQDGMRLPLAWTGWPYAQSGASPLELVHELTHTLGLSHAGDQYGETTTNPNYPDPSGRVEPNAYGFDVWNLQAIPPHSPAGETHDFMSYNSLDPAWVSIYTWETVGELLGQPNLDV